MWSLVAGDLAWTIILDAFDDQVRARIEPCAAVVIPAPKSTEHPDPGGVSRTTRTSSLPE